VRRLGICLSLISFQTSNDPLQVLVPLHPPDLGRQGLPLDGVQARIAQPRSLGLERTNSRSRNEASRPLSQAGQVAAPCFDDRLLGPGLDLPFRLGFCCSISL
jgi:hypothetical protein